MYVIRFTRGSRRRYATQTRGDPEYNAIDTANLEDAKTWKTQRGANNYLKSKVLIGRSGQRIQKRWDVIEVIEVDVQRPVKNTEIICKSRPMIVFFPIPSILDWLESERRNDESDTELLNRKLKNLIDLQLR